MYQAELAKNPTSRAAESSRSNMIALRHTIEQIYGRGPELRHPWKVGLPALTAGAREVTKVLSRYRPSV